MGYIKIVLPVKDYRLIMVMEGGSIAIIDFSCKLHTMKYAELADEALFKTAITDGDFVIWGDGKLRLTVNELMDIMLLG